jgi:hypothetical protein
MTFLGFQFESGITYTVTWTIAADFSSIVAISDGINGESHSAGSIPINISLNQLVIANLSGISFDTPGQAEVILYCLGSAGIGIFPPLLSECECSLIAL